MLNTVPMLRLSLKHIHELSKRATTVGSISSIINDDNILCYSQNIFSRFLKYRPGTNAHYNSTIYTKNNHCRSPKYHLGVMDLKHVFINTEYIIHTEQRNAQSSQHCDYATVILAFG